MIIRTPAWPHYTVAGALVVFPFYEIIANNLLPIQLGNARWRVAAFGLLSASLLLITVGVMIAYWLSNTFEHRRFQLFLGVGACALAALIVLLVGAFGLDVLQLRGGVRPEAMGPFYAATSVAVLRALVCAVAIAGFGVASVRAGLDARREQTRAASRVATNGPAVVGVRPPGTVTAGRDRTAN